MKIRIRLAKYPLYTHHRLTHTHKKATKKQTHQVLFPPHILVRLISQSNANRVDFSPYFLDSGNWCLFISNRLCRVYTQFWLRKIRLAFVRCSESFGYFRVCSRPFSLNQGNTNNNNCLVKMALNSIFSKWNQIIAFNRRSAFSLPPSRSAIPLLLRVLFSACMFIKQFISIS